VDSLLARGIAKLTLGLGDNLESPTAPVEPAAAPAATGVLGFGLGGRAALTGAEGVPAAALYPGCAGLPDASGTVLILQGDAACPTAPMASPRLLLIPGAGHAWDAPGALWPSPGPLLPDPAGGPRLGARADHAVTLLAAEAIADWFEQRLVGAATPPVIPAWSTRR
jgi:dienelactone hydrolase